MFIVLIGYMGSGKSTVGRMLSETAGIPFMDFDAHIENRLGASIPEIFASRGELYFRKTEHELLGELLASNPSVVLALGGGTPCYAGNMERLLEHTSSICYLQLSVGALAERLQDEKAQRPLIAHLSDMELPEFIGKHLFERAPFYSKAPYTVRCDGKTAAEITAEIKAQLGI